MSGPAEQWAWQLQDERLSLSEKFVLVYLARRAYYDDGCGAWPSVNTIAAHLPLHTPFRAARVEALAGTGLLARGRPGAGRAQSPQPRTHPQGPSLQGVGRGDEGRADRAGGHHRSRRDRRGQGRSGEA
ncbi:helix-turn-helix domain-containing protein [Bifidobacterium moukalabense]|uniref:helix-turn-helix domain-containing protein n=1 Tax=Bifidobacterium moukalabense TaxID=1333651 RepID=UPI003530923C